MLNVVLFLLHGGAKDIYSKLYFFFIDNNLNNLNKFYKSAQVENIKLTYLKLEMNANYVITHFVHWISK